MFRFIQNLVRGVAQTGQTREKIAQLQELQRTLPEQRPQLAPSLRDALRTDPAYKPDTHTSSGRQFTYDAFISYSRLDAESAVQLERKLLDHNIRVYRDERN